MNETGTALNRTRNEWHESITYAVYGLRLFCFYTWVTLSLTGHGGPVGQPVFFYPSHSRAVSVFIYFVACSDGDAHASQSAPTETAAMM